MHVVVAMTLAVVLAGCGGGSAGTTEGADDTSADQPILDEGSSDTAPAGDASSGDPLAGAPLIEPVNRFAVDGAAEGVYGIALSPDGSTVAVALPDDRGIATSIQFYDAASGTLSGSVDLDVISFGTMHWMADGRLVALTYNDDDFWQSWDGSTFEALPSVPADIGCAEGKVDKATGAVYSTDGLGSMGDTICRVDTATGTTTIVPDGTFESPDAYWVRPGANEVVVLHSPTQNSRELITLDAATFEATSSTELTFYQQVKAVGVTTWIQDDETNASFLLPGEIAVPRITDPLESSGAGTMFISANGSDDHVLVSATDGSVIGVFPAVMNLSNWSDWSIDDSVFARATLDNHIEIFRF